ncbi:hypothetical protein [Mycobacterium antarcticum]|uniref:hypothetical protein n=1 Tax=Mycolicibacterium sp. TUM20984 TaxID=3023368 RepID=UPI0024E18665|nr:hypothetical protein [Mycolicibacterium sp. TUM20984]
MLSRIVIGLVAAGAAVFGVPGVAAADPEPGPPPSPPAPNVMGYAPVKPSEFLLQDGSVYGFAVPGDIACVISRGSGNYGCSGPIPAAPNGANVVTGGQIRPAGFSNADRPLYVFETLPQRLPAGTKISFRNVTCGTDGTTTACTNNYDGGGFVISPAGSFVVDANNPLIDRPQPANPYFN